MQVAIPFLPWTGKAALEVEIPDDTAEQSRLRAAVEIAISTGADLSRADLSRANLSRADLSRANLSSANLRGADLSDANLSRANLSRANLSHANLSDANLRGADLSSAILSNADLRGAILRGADLSGANLSGAKNVGDFTMSDGLKFSEYLRDVVPALLTAGGKTVEAIMAAGAWDCHDWSNCPMHAAFGIASADEAPPLLRARVKEFVQFFDQGLIPVPETRKTES